MWDDLIDAFQLPAGPDWLEGRNNLAILYASTAAYDQRDHFVSLIAQADDPARLDEAQTILIRSGAVSYCVYQLAQRVDAARRQLADMSLGDPRPLDEILDAQVALIAAWLEGLGIPVPAELQRGRP